jgi:hypothetical protein
MSTHHLPPFDPSPPLDQTNYHPHPRQPIPMIPWTTKTNVLASHSSIPHVKKISNFQPLSVYKTLSPLTIQTLFHCLPCPFLPLSESQGELVLSLSLSEYILLWHRLDRSVGFYVCLCVFVTVYGKLKFLLVMCVAACMEFLLHFFCCKSGRKRAFR